MNRPGRHIVGKIGGKISGCHDVCFLVETLGGIVLQLVQKKLLSEDRGCKQAQETKHDIEQGKFKIKCTFHVGFLLKDKYLYKQKSAAQLPGFKFVADAPDAAMTDVL